MLMWVSDVSSASPPPSTPLLVISPFTLAILALEKFWGYPKRGPSGHFSPWPPGVRLCPAGKMVLVNRSNSPTPQSARPWRLGQVGEGPGSDL